ncbi:2Fe-2S iron-sulfur cluster-binding protein [Burkholderia alba]|uniref:2Fe-2S iron-sulfur cluster-binding protein n=1 Tax=Burkholderia alba TaxID=2683677 RepID=UPI002B061703|nr:pyridoxamine 5'-phosphate oxidase family protein [Burkholderia alba]
MTPTAPIAPTAATDTTTPFHEGERAAQHRAGVADLADASARGIRTYMTDQHREFFAQLPFVIVGGVDAAGQPWATLRVGAPGFARSPEPRTLVLAGGELRDDPLAGTWRAGSALGMLGLEPHTRRRNRMNGVIASLDGDAMAVTVGQSFGNCPKYIQSRTPERIAPDSAMPAPQRRAARLDAADRALLARADTFFIASANTAADAGGARGVDVSHRGGMPGFVRVDDAVTLTTPDFSGNNFFNTIGNLLRDPRAGLLFVDFDSGDLLYVAADAEIVWDGPELAAFDGAKRLVRFHVREVRRSPAVLPLRWSPVRFAPQFGAPASGWRAFDVAAVHDEAAAIRSFYLEAADGLPLAPCAPGQHLTLRLPVPGGAPLVRSYTVSDAADGRRYRITVKRGGAASAWLHDAARPGARIEAMAPRGAFTFDASSPRPAVLVSAGIGITPMIAMLNSELAREADGADARRIVFVHGARRGRDRPFAAMLARAARMHSRLTVHLFDSSRPDGAADGAQPGRVEIDALKRLLPFDDYDFYLCGPAPFMTSLYDGLRALNVPDERIRFEAFGPSSVRRTGTPARAAASNAPPAATVVFGRSRQSAGWSPRDGSLLELAEANGVTAASDCRSGTCGTCSTRVLDGRVAYSGPVDAEVAPGCALICMASPAEGAGRVVLDL